MVTRHLPEPEGRHAEVWLDNVNKITKLISSRVMKSGEYSDLTILCEDQTFSVHKVVVCSQSKVLAAAMKKGFKVLQNPVAMAWHPLHHQDQADICSSFSGIRVEHYQPE